jgi:hypothetical protein
LRHVFGILVRLQAHLGAAPQGAHRRRRRYALPFEAAGGERITSLVDAVRSPRCRPVRAAVMGASLDDGEIIDFVCSRSGARRRAAAQAELAG